MDYLINYTAFDKDGKELRSLPIKMNNKLDEKHATASLEKYLVDRYPDFGMLVVHSCKMDDWIKNVFGRWF